MNQTEQSKEIIDVIENGNNIAIMPNNASGCDGFSAGVSLYFLLKNKEKNVSLVYQGDIPKGCEDLIEVEELTKDLSKNELLLSIDYSDTPAAKVKYSTENNILYLRIAPVDKNFDINRVKTELTGKNYDVIITIGAQKLDDFGQTFRDLESQFYSSKLINLDNTDKNVRFGNYNVVDPFEESLSLLVLNVTRLWGYKLDSKSAKALLSGMTYREEKSSP